ncbi:ATP-dependent DNA ligase [Dyella lipolytica]|uniref:DNA ligase n=1 Tax=Dyella lipolytica TaxID=1867835 RepID=A0ABW8IWQ0_9GAMM|nr:DNA ligase [Dyella lipolytica]GLQ47715.1 ATP-dependent DNA ligase [Dyella lipolytica]
MRKSARSVGVLRALPFVIGLLVNPVHTAAATLSPVMLANVYHSGVALGDYWVSEKYDGVRGYWDGEKLLTRSGTVIHPPAWFTAHWPKTPMDGELWAGRGQFDMASATIRQQPADDEAWRHIRYMVFDVPGQPGSFDERLPALKRLIAELNVPWVRAVRQYKVADEAELQRQLDDVVQGDGEGLVLHRGASRYHAGRSEDMLKFKPFDDAEARVVEQVPGKGKYTGMMGALLVEMPNGTRFRIGTGFSDAQRRNPPPVGSVVTYRYQGMTSGGKPRFARFMRIRDEM